MHPGRRDAKGPRVHEKGIRRESKETGPILRRRQPHRAETAQVRIPPGPSSLSNTYHSRWIQAKLISKKALSKDTKRYTFALPSKDQKLGLDTGQHILVGFHFKDQMIIRSYTPIRPIQDSDEDGTFELAVKTYYPDPAQPGGTLSNIMDCLREGEEVEIKGPTGEIRYHGNGRFVIDDKEYVFDKVTLVLGGSGITPGYQVIARILRAEEDKTKIRVIDANASGAG